MTLFGSLYKLFSFLVRYTRHIRHAHLVGAGVIVLAVLSGLANTALIALVNAVINAESPGRGLLFLFLGVCALFPLLRYLGDALLIYLTEQATLNLRLTLSARIMAVPLRRLEELGTPRLTNTLVSDLTTVVSAMSLIPLLSLNLTIVVGSLTFMGLLSWQMLIGVLVFLVIGMIAYQVPLMKGHGYIRQLRGKGDDLFRHFRALTEGIKELKLHQARRHAFLDTKLRTTALEVLDLNGRAGRAFSSAVSWGQVLIFLLIAVISFALPLYTPVEKPVLTGFTFAILYMVGPIQAILNSMATLTRAITSMERVEKVGVELAEAAHPDERLVTEGVRQWSSLELRGVEHTYFSERDGTSFTLGPVDLSFQPGEVVFITGGNGSGKTTFAKILTGLYAPEAGEVRLDGQVIDEAAEERYRSLFSCVFSDFYLFDSLLGLERDSLDSEAAVYLQLLELDHKVSVTEGKLSTTNLSSGQRKRLGLLTAYLEDRPIYLFDEWAADQDPHFKNVFYHELIPRLQARGKTVFAISHDDRFYGVADRLIKLDMGKVVLDARMDSVLPAEVRLHATPLVAAAEPAVARGG